MASPQTKNGYTRIANEILDQVIMTNLNGTQFRLVMAIWRYTYGFQRKSHEMSVSYLAELIKSSRSHVDRELKALIERKIVTVTELGPKGARVLQFNKNYNEWSDKESEGKTVPFPSKDKKPIKTNKKPKYSNSDTYYKMATYFYSKVEKVAQEAGIEHLIRKSNMQSWADDMRKLVENDKVSKRKVKEVMDWVVTDSFWKTNILSASKLRKQFAQLAIKMSAQQTPHQLKVQPDHRDKEIAFQQWIQNGGEPDEFNWNE